jgi:hypothetical protein
MHMCIANCFVLTLENGHFTNAEHTSTFLIDSFTRESVVMHRTDFGPSFQGSAVLRGRLSSDGNSIVDGKIEWTSGNTGTWPYKAAWGTAINTVPGSNAERDRGKPPQPQVVIRPVVCVPWFFTMVCGQ